jgi:hypothetical protein
MELEKSKHIHFLLNIMNGLGRQSGKVIISKEKIYFIQNSSLVSAPFVPSVNNDEDTSNFNEIDKHDGPLEESFSTNKAFVGNHLSFIGFSFSNEQQ